MSTLLLRGGIIGGRAQDLRIRDGLIERIGDTLEPGGGDVIDIAGKLVLPGFIETHIHPDKA